MPLTHFPNGISVQASSASSANAGAGDLDANQVYGETISITVVGTSAAVTQYVGVPFAGTVQTCVVAVLASASSALTYAVSIGSAGAELSAASTGAFAVAGGVRTQAVSGSATAVAITDSLKFVSGAAGTAGSNSCTITLKRT